MIVLIDTPAERGLIEFPMQKPHALSRILAPASMRSARYPSRASIAITWREPGAMPRPTRELTFLPLSIFATVTRSLYDEFVQEPMQTWSTFMPASSEILFTFPGLCGQAAIGSIEERSSSMTRS